VVPSLRGGATVHPRARAPLRAGRARPDRGRQPRAEADRRVRPRVAAEERNQVPRLHGREPGNRGRLPRVDDPRPRADRQEGQRPAGRTILRPSGSTPSRPCSRRTTPRRPRSEGGQARFADRGTGSASSADRERARGRPTRMRRVPSERPSRDASSDSSTAADASD
jgi:hypothetical protein